MVANAQAELFDLDPRIRDLWAPRERITPSVWADKYRQLQREYSAEAGPWRTARTPYLAGVMDAFADPAIETIVFVKSARVGGTEAINNMLAWAVDQEPGPVLYVYPTQTDAEEECRDRIAHFIANSPRLARHIPGEGWDTKTELTLTTCRIYMAWAKAPRTLIRRTIRYVFVDEVDNCDHQAGALGDTVALVRKRVTTFRDRGKVVLNSTPSKSYAAAWRTWNESDQRHYHVPCPKCGVYQVLVFDRLRVPDKMRNHKKILHRDLAWYQCRECEAKLDYRKHQRWMVERGVWVAAAQRITQRLPVKRKAIVARAVCQHPNRWTPKLVGRRPPNKSAGFHVWAAYSPWVSWSQIMAEWFAAQKNPDELRVFVNATLGEPFEDAVEKVEADELKAKRVGGLPRDIVPLEAQVLVAFADVQKDKIYYGIRAWGYYRQSWLIREGICLTFDELYEVCTRRYERADGGDPLSPLYLAIDSGARTHEVYEFARANPGVFAVKGQQDPVYNVRPSEIKYMLGKSVRQLVVTLFHVNTWMYKTMLYKMIHTPVGDPGAWHLNSDTTDDYCHQVTAEHQVWKVVTQGRARRRVLVWEPKSPHADNHFLDAEVYGMAIADFRGVLAMKPEEAQARKPQPEKKNAMVTPDGRPFLVTER